MNSILRALVIILLTGVFFLPAVPSNAQGALESISNTVESAIDTAVDSVENALSSEDATQAATEEIKKRIEKKVIENAISPQEQKKGYIGEITRVTEDSIAVETVKRNIIIPLEDSNIVIFKDDTAIEPADIEVGNWTIVMGVLEDDQIVPKIIQVFEDTLRPRTQKVFIGSITDITGLKLTVIARGEETEQEITLSQNTIVEDFDGAEAVKTDLSEEINCLFIGFEDEDGVDITKVRSLAPLTEESE